MREQPVILNVDDHGPSRYARSRVLAGSGFNVIEASTGAEALQLIEARRPDLLLLDVNLPDVNGIDLCRRLKSERSGFSLMVLQISASSVTASSATASLDAGSDAYLTEPIEPEVLIATVKAMLRLHQTERSLAEANRRLEVINRELVRSNEDLQQFAFAASHDLQEPLRTITTFTEMLQAELASTLSNEQKERFQHIVRGAERLRQLIRDLLAYSQVGREDCAPEEVDLNKVVNWAFSNLEQQFESVGGVLEIPALLPSVWGDFPQLAMLFQNLFSNSLKYRKPDVTPVIRISATRSGKAEWTIQIADNGIGIPPEYREQVFAPFKRLHGKELPGTGIGLALCRRVAQSHSGKLWIGTESTDGALFHLSLRASQSGERPAGSAAAQS